MAGVGDAEAKLSDGHNSWVFGVEYHAKVAGRDLDGVSIVTPAGTCAPNPVDGRTAAVVYRSAGKPHLADLATVIGFEPAGSLTATSAPSVTASTVSTPCARLLERKVPIVQSGFVLVGSDGPHGYGGPVSIIGQFESVLDQVSRSDSDCAAHLGTFRGTSDLCGFLPGDTTYSIGICAERGVVTLSVTHGSGVLTHPVTHDDIMLAVALLAFASTYNEQDALRLMDPTGWDSSRSQARCGAALPDTTMLVEQSLPTVTHVSVFACGE